MAYTVYLAPTSVVPPDCLRQDKTGQVSSDHGKGWHLEGDTRLGVPMTNPTPYIYTIRELGR